MRRFYENFILNRAQRILERKNIWDEMDLRIPFRPDYNDYPYAEVYKDLEFGSGALPYITAEQYELDHSIGLKRLRILLRRWRVSKMSHARQLVWLKSQIQWPVLRYQKSSIKRHDPAPIEQAEDTEEQDG